MEEVFNNLSSIADTRARIFNSYIQERERDARELAMNPMVVEAMGQAFPERGVMFSFAPGPKARQVAQILIEPITAEPFLLRAKTDVGHPHQRTLRDLEYALTSDEWQASQGRLQR